MAEPNPYSFQTCYCSVGYCYVPSNGTGNESVSGCQPNSAVLSYPWKFNKSIDLATKFQLAQNHTNDTQSLKELVFHAFPECESRAYNLTIDWVNTHLSRCLQAQQMLEMCGPKLVIFYFTQTDQRWMDYYWQYSVIQYVMKMITKVGAVAAIRGVSIIILGRDM